MTKAKYHAYIQSPEWKAIAEEVKRRADWRCQLCNSDLELHAHHRSYKWLGQESDHMEDLVCLCKTCHKRYHEAQKKPTKPEPPKARLTASALAEIAPPKKRRRRTSKAQRRQSKKNRKKAANAQRKKEDIDSLFDEIVGHRMVYVDRRVLLAIETDRGGYSKAAMDIMGLRFPLPAGWKKDLIGTSIPMEQFLAARAARNSTIQHPYS